MRDSSILKELRAHRRILVYELDRIDMILASLEKSEKKMEAKMDEEKKENEFYHDLFELTYVDTKNEQYLTQIEMYQWLKNKLTDQSRLTDICVSHGWSHKTSNNPLWRGLVKWMINNGHERFRSPETGARCIMSVSRNYDAKFDDFVKKWESADTIDDE